MIRSSMGAVNCANVSANAGVELGFPDNNDKAVAQMFFVSQVTLSFCAQKPNAGTGIE